jgi:hypothetical protein
MISRVDLAWIAGLFEGEGCVQLQTNKSVHLTVSMADPDVVARLASYWGTRVHEVNKRTSDKPHYKTQFRTYVTGRKAIGWALTLYPLLGLRRKLRIQEVIGAWRSRPCAAALRTHCPKGHPYSGANLLVYRDRNSVVRVCRECKSGKVVALVGQQLTLDHGRERRPFVRSS